MPRIEDAGRWVKRRAARARAPFHEATRRRAAPGRLQALGHGVSIDVAAELLQEYGLGLCPLRVPMPQQMKIDRADALAGGSRHRRPSARSVATLCSGRQPMPNPAISRRLTSSWCEEVATMRPAKPRWSRKIVSGDRLSPRSRWRRTRSSRSTSLRGGCRFCRTGRGCGRRTRHSVAAGTPCSPVAWASGGTGAMPAVAARCAISVTISLLGKTSSCTSMRGCRR